MNYFEKQKQQIESIKKVSFDVNRIIVIFIVVMEI